MTEDLDAQIQECACRIWLEQGRPEGRAASHWDLARLLLAQENAPPEMLRSAETPAAEPIEAWTNQSELPTLSEQVAPGDMADPNR
jgi:hypothetical protein